MNVLEIISLIIFGILIIIFGTWCYRFYNKFTIKQEEVKDTAWVSEKEFIESSPIKDDLFSGDGEE